jgi:hypothetical protein
MKRRSLVVSNTLFIRTAVIVNSSETLFNSSLLTYPVVFISCKEDSTYVSILRNVVEMLRTALFCRQPRIGSVVNHTPTLNLKREDVTIFFLVRTIASLRRQ